jgi:transposase
MEELKELKHLLQLVLQNNENLRTLNANLMAQIAELETQQKLNSQNSHPPPSQDKFKATPQTGLPKALGKDKGGQKCHKGDTLKMVSQADKIEPYLPHRCLCGADLSNISSTIVERRQVFDIPSPRLAVTEYQRMTKVCHCGCVNTGVFPSEVKAPVQYGAGVMSFTTLLSAGFHLSYQHISQLFKDLYGYNLNEATSLENNNRCYVLLEGAEQAIKDKILASCCVHFDETAINCSQSSAWLHTSSTPQYTHQFVRSKRGGEALACSESLIPHFTHTAAHDCRSPYFHFDQCQHALCGATFTKRMLRFD